MTTKIKNVTHKYPYSVLYQVLCRQVSSMADVTDQVSIEGRYTFFTTTMRYSTRAMGGRQANYK